MQYPHLGLLCRNLGCGLATKTRVCKGVGQEGSLGVTFHALGSVVSNLILDH
jgi:hypothetical protein